MDGRKFTCDFHTSIITVLLQSSDKFTTRAHSCPAVCCCATPANNTSVKEEILVFLVRLRYAKGKMALDTLVLSFPAYLTIHCG